MKLRTKFILKGLFHSLLQLLAIFIFAWFNDCILEMAIIYVCFFIFRSTFEKQYHAPTTWLCTIYTFIVFFIVSLITPSIKVSVILIICFTYFINKMSFYIRDYLDLKDRFKASKVKICKSMNKDTLLEICKFNNLNELETKILTYYYCDRLSLTAISYKLNYSYDYIASLKSKTMKRLNES